MRRIAALGVVFGLTACTATPPSPPPPTTTTIVLEPVVASDWPTYHHDNGRSGFAPALEPLSTLSQAWHAKLDGAVYGQPLLVNGNLLAATENDTVYSLDPGTGAVQWSINLGTPMPKEGLPCGNIDPLGITSTMAYDRLSGRVYALAETAGGSHTLVGIGVKSGAVEIRAGVEPPRGTPVAHQQRSALTITDDRVFVAYGGLLGDCGDYIGSVVSVRTDGNDRRSYAVPTTREAGIWAPGGAVVDNDRLLYSVGNGESTENYDGSDSVIALTTANLDRADIFTPQTWAEDNARDLDLGSSSPVLAGQYVLATGKRGTTYVLQSGALAEPVSTMDTCPSFGGASTRDDLIVMPCINGGPKALTISNAGQLTPRWTSPVKAQGSPTIGGGAVWVVDYAGGVLYALDEATGAVRGQLQIGPAPHFASPTLSGARAYVGTMDGVVAVNGA